MLRSITTRLTYANVMATIALFIALGGVSYAALELPRNSVRSAQIAPGAVRSADLARRAVTSAHVKDGSLQQDDFKTGLLPSAHASVVARIRSSAPVQVGGGVTQIPLEGAEWDQAPGELNLLFGRATVTSQCPRQGSLTILIHDKGRLISSPYMKEPGQEPTTLSFVPLFEPRSKASHSLTAIAGGNCNNDAGRHTIERLDIAVVRVP
jgi:hypothetical protein